MDNKKLRILVISRLDVWSLGKKKGNQSLYNTLMGYAKRGHKVHFITWGAGGFRSTEDKRNPVSEIHSNVRIYRYPYFYMKISRLIQKLPFLRYLKIGYLVIIALWISVLLVSTIVGYRIIRKNRINLLYGHETYGVPVAYMLGKIFRIPNISRFQGCIFYNENLKNPLVLIRFLINILAYKTPADLVIMTDDGTKGDEVLQRLKTPMKCMRFWRNGVRDMFIPTFDSKRFKEELGISPSSKIILAVSQLRDWKRVDRIISAMPSIVSKEQKIMLVIVGDGPERINLETLCKELGVEQHVMFTGVVSHDEIPKFMNVADIFVSLYDLSNVGNPLLEAMTCGKCIVTLNNGTTEELIKNNETGILLNPDDLKTLPDVIVKLLHDDTRRNQLGNKVKKYANTHLWTWEERMKREIEFVENLCGLRIRAS